jgi:uncharacterized protein (DUF4415 family)
MKKIRGTVEAWETGLLGTNPTTQVPATQAQENQLDTALGLQPISIRLQKEVIEKLKLIAKSKGIGYQPLIRMVLTKYTNGQQSTEGE